MGRAIFPARPFTRECYMKYRKMKQYHHIKVANEIRENTEMWASFLNSDNSVFRPFVDYKLVPDAEETGFFTDAAGSVTEGGYSNKQYCFGKWPRSFMVIHKPSIKYLELYAATVTLLLWAKDLSNSRVVIFCDNASVVHMLNSTSSNSSNCLTLIRLITMESLRRNVHFFCQHIEGKRNLLADRLSRNKLKLFWEIAPEGTQKTPLKVPAALWPISKLWKTT